MDKQTQIAKVAESGEDRLLFARIYDRLLGCCFPQEISGPSRRKKELRDSFGDMRSILGL